MKWTLLTIGGAAAAAYLLYKSFAERKTPGAVIADTGQDVGTGIGDAMRRGYWGFGRGVTGAAEDARQGVLADETAVRTWQEGSASLGVVGRAERPTVRQEKMRTDSRYLYEQAADWKRAVGSGNSPLAAEIMADFQAVGVHPSHVLQTSKWRPIQKMVG